MWPSLRRICPFTATLGPRPEANQAEPAGSSLAVRSALLAPAGAGRRRRARGAGRRNLVFVAFRRADEELFLDDFLAPADLLLDLVGDVRIGLEELADIVAALADPLAVPGEPGAGLVDHPGLDAQVDD